MPLFVATASFFLCILLWVRSSFYREGIYRHRMTDSPTIERTLYIFWFRGGLHFGADRYDVRSWSKEEERWQLRLSPEWLQDNEDRLIKAYGHGHAGFYYLRWVAKDAEDYDFAMLIIPIWAPLVTSGLFPAKVICRRLKNRRRLSSGRCAVCGYDLRATPQKCPECGTPANKVENANCTPGSEL